MKTIAITGTTGLLGRNFLFEIAKRHISSNSSIDIILLGRSNNSKSFKDRILEILCEDGVLYCGMNKSDLIKDFFFQNIRFVDFDLKEEELGINSKGIHDLQLKPIDNFFHIAALTDFRDSQSSIDALWKSNVEGTKKVLSLISRLTVKEFDYVGSAYSCGCNSGEIPPDFIPENDVLFRNPYEKSKLEGELEVRKFETKSKVLCKYFRPSTICGRLMEPPLGKIHKFDVFYGWAQFFLRAKLKMLPQTKDIYSIPIDLPIRILCSEWSGLNIIPADYAAKLMYEISFSENKLKFFHLVNSSETPHYLYLTHIMKTLNITGTHFVPKEPDDLNPIEKLYYKTVGKIYTPYTTSEPILFDTTSINSCIANKNLVCPKVDDISFPILMKYAKKANFGIAVGTFT